MDFDFRSNVEDKSVEGFNNHALLLILGLSALFILPSIFLVLLMIILPSIDIELLEYFAYFLGYGSYIALLIYILKKENVKSIISGFDKNNLKFAILGTIVLFLSSMIISIILTLIFGNVSNENQSTLDQGMIKYPLVVTLFSIVFAPIVEELVFRFSIYRPIAKKNKYIAYIVSVLFFAGIHFLASISALSPNIEEYGSEVAYSMFFDDLKTLPIYLVAAFILTLSYDINRNIATNIMIHAFYNFSQVLIMIFTTSLLNGTEQACLLFNYLNIDEIKSLLTLVGI